MIAAFLLFVPAAGLALLLAQRLVDSPADWRRRAATAALVVAALLLGRVLIIVADGAPSRQPSDVPSNSIVLSIALLGLAVTGLVLTVRGLLAMVRGQPERLAVGSIGWVLLLAPLLYTFGVVAVVLLPITLLVLGIWRLKRLREARVLTLLATALQSEQPIGPILEAYAGRRRRNADDEAKRRKQKPLHEMADLLISGRSVPDAGAVSRVLSPRTVDVLRAAESGGRLADAASDLAAEMRRKNERAPFRDLLGNLSYLWAIGLIGANIVGFITVFIIPKFKEIFYDFNIPLDLNGALPTQVGRYDDLPATLLLFQGLLLSAVVAGLIALRGTDWSPRQLRLLPRRIGGGHVLRTLAEPLLAGQPIEPAVHVLQQNAPDDYWQQTWGRLETSLGEGQPLAAALRKHRLITPAEAAAIASAAPLGSTGPVLRELAEQRERAAQTRGQIAGTLLRLATIGVAAFVTLILATFVFSALSDMIAHTIVG